MKTEQEVIKARQEVSATPNLARWAGIIAMFAMALATMGTDGCANAAIVSPRAQRVAFGTDKQPLVFIVPADGTMTFRTCNGNAEGTYPVNRGDKVEMQTSQDQPKTTALVNGNAVYTGRGLFDSLPNEMYFEAD